MINIHKAIYAINPAIVTIKGDIAYDIDGNEVPYNMAQAEAKLIELQTQSEADAQAVIDTKASALAKLAKLGLTQDEVKALVG
jgi:hypothetical protein